MSQFDPWISANEATKSVWTAYVYDLRKGLAIQVQGVDYLRHADGHSGQYGQVIVDGRRESQQLVIEIFDQSFQEVVGLKSEVLVRSFTPPAGYGKAGRDGIVDVLAEWIPRHEDIRSAITSHVLGTVLQVAAKKLRGTWNASGTPNFERSMPVFHPAWLEDSCILHAITYSNIGQPICASVFPSSAMNADYSVRNLPFTIVVDCDEGSIFYSVTNRMKAASILEFTHEGIRELELGTWDSMYGGNGE